MAYAESWHVRSRARECAATQRVFTDGETIVTALFPDPESSGYTRRDYGLEAWNQRPADAEKPFSFWKTTFSGPTGTTIEDPAEKLSPEELLVRLIEEDQDHTENTRYILAVMLERQKLLRETDNQRTANGILRVYEHRKTGEIFLIRDPDIPLSQVEAVQKEVFTLLENNGRTPEPIIPEDVGESGDRAESADVGDSGDSGDSTDLPDLPDSTDLPDSADFIKPEENSERAP